MLYRRERRQRLLAIHARLQARQYPYESSCQPLRPVVLLTQANRRPVISPAYGEIDRRGRHDTHDHRAPLAVANASAYNAGIAAEPALPDSIAQNQR